jgi:cellulose synthase operon protein C
VKVSFPVFASRSLLGGARSTETATARFTATARVGGGWLHRSTDTATATATPTNEFHPTASGPTKRARGRGRGRALNPFTTGARHNADSTVSLASRTSLVAVAAFALASVLAQPACARQSAAADPYAAWRAGEYDAAIAGLERLVRETPTEVRARVALVEVLMEVGRWDDAEEAARAAVAQPAIGAALANTLGEVLWARGRRDEAVAAFQQSVEGNAPDALSARLNLAVADWERGERDAALAAFDSFIDVYNGAAPGQLSSPELVAIGTAVRYLGIRDPQLFHDAVKAYTEAIAAADGDPNALPSAAFEPRLLMGELFLEKYDSPEAYALFREVEQLNPNHPAALLGIARARYFDGSNESLELVTKSLDVNEQSVPARVLHGRLLLDVENYDEAKDQVERALRVNPSSLDALTMLGAIAYLSGDDAAYEEARTRVLAIDPKHADFYNTIAELAVRNRRYADAVELAGQATALEPRSWWGHGIIGLNLLRKGEIDAARASLESSFAGDPYNAWIKNTLDLLDTFGEYTTHTTPHFELMLHGDEAALLAPYFGELAEEAYAALAARYGSEPPTPIRLEVYPRHADFSVRTVGLAGLGALGVSFGSLLAMDSPAARERGQFNWGSTLWHEIAHAFTLAATEHRIPRWLTEGLSVVEERRARPGWGDDASLEFLAAWKSEELYPVSELNNGFVRPKFPQQVGLSYVQASYLVEMIEQEHGFDAVLAMLRGYRDGRSDTEVFRDVLRMDGSALDDAYERYIDGRFGETLAALPARMVRDTAGGNPLARIEAESGGLFGALSAGRRALEAGELDAAAEQFEKAKTLFPGNAGPLSPYRFLADVYEQKGDLQRAADELKAYTAINENDDVANLKLAELLDGLGDHAGAAAALERVLYIYPYDAALHEKLAELHAATGDAQGVVRERRALVALDPVDRAEALYQLALAYFEAGDREAARREVLRALEIAPNFERAQELLLRLRGAE